MVPNLIVSIAGLPKAGKTHLALTFPAPMVVFSFDLGFEIVRAKFAGKEINVKTYSIPILESSHPKPYAQPIWQEFVKDYKKAIWDKEIKTVVVDPATTVWELDRHAYTEELGQKQLLPVQYSEPNARMSALLTEPRISGVNLVLTHYLRDIYVNDKATGELELDGFKRTEGLVDLVLHLQREQRPAKGGGKENFIRTIVKDNRYDLALNGMDFENGSYDDLIALLGVGE